MCQREESSLQRGMNFRLRGGHSVILMSRRSNAPYQDRLEDGGSVLIYEGHDMPKSGECLYPKEIDQPMRLPSGRLTQNGKFYEAARKTAAGPKPPDLVRVYEKLQTGIWADNGYFHLVAADVEHDGKRKVNSGWLPLMILHQINGLRIPTAKSARPAGSYQARSNSRSGKETMGVASSAGRLMNFIRQQPPYPETLVPRL